MAAATTLTIEYSYFYPEEEYLKSASSPTYKGFRKSEVTESYSQTFTTIESLTAFVTKITGIPAATQKYVKSGQTKPLDLSKPNRSVTKLGLADGDTVVLQTLDFPGPYNYGQITEKEKAAMRKAYPPPAYGNDLETPEQLLEWAKWESDTADSNIYNGAGNLADATPGAEGQYAAYPFVQQYYNPANPKTKTGKVSVTKVISWNGLPGLLRSVRPYKDLYEQADSTNSIGERAQQTEYCEWKAFTARAGKNKGRVTKIVLTCEGPEYWQTLFDVNPAKCVELYQQLTGIATITADDLIAKKNVVLPGTTLVLAKKGHYNFYNKYNTTLGIVHLNQHNNFLSAELNIASMSSQPQQEKDHQGNLRILEKALPLVQAGQYGSPGRNSDPTIGFVCNWVARHPLGLRLTIDPPVALYFGLLNTSGWELPPGMGNIADWVKCTRGNPATDQGLRYEIAPPKGVDGFVDDILIGGQPLQYGGQAARCMTVQLTGRASPFSPGVAPPVRPRNDIATSLLISDPASGQPTGKLLASANLKTSGATVVAKSRVPVESEAKTSRRVMNNSNPPVDSPAEAADKIRDQEHQTILDVDDIQGDPLVGFNTSHSIIVTLDIGDVDATKTWLAEVVLPNVTTTRQVLDRHRHMASYRRATAQGDDSVDPPDYLYTNVSFSNGGLVKLTSKRDAKQFYAVGNSEAFAHGLPQRSTLLGDPEVGTGASGARDEWLFGGERTPDIMVQLQGDTDEACQEYAAHIQATFAQCGEVVFVDIGHRRPGALEKPKEQFGFHDGISNPDVRGTYRDDETNELKFIAKREIDKSDSRAPFYSQPGTNLVWPGEIILGEKKQRTLDSSRPAPPPQHFWLAGDDDFVGPTWAKNGTFVVYRRLRQDVAAFWNHAKAGAEDMNAQFTSQSAPGGWDTTKMASRFIGRWPSGCPIMLSPDKDVVEWGNNSMTQNAFNYATDTAPFPSVATSQPVEGVPTIPQDNIGLRCPMGSHIRKVDPRDQGTDFGPDEDTLKHRFIRRGTPYGDFVTEKNKFKNDGKDRGLQFIAYMASIDMQFEFVIRFWANVDQQPVAMTAGAADDMVIGQPAYKGYERKLTALELNKDGIPAVATTTPTTDRWITATGGGYFFMPSISALHAVVCKQ